jgi:hypothetical protein
VALVTVVLFFALPVKQSYLGPFGLYS